ncbi:hypothetical protein [Streptomyces sp. NBC_01207]|uniref:hypothetical protein n=1 Tax=Streptomyces sp. NBC_01207 TaxID=2903772 RepID=UPI002E10C4EF|nr:hypothetical protein OG457_27105 [Streptomyces sp. NBC_01207]
MSLTTLPGGEPRRTALAVAGHEATTTPRHDDGTLCGHTLTEHGKALEAGCSGCKDYVTTCSCGAQWTGVVRSSLEYLHGQHLRVLAAPAWGGS